MHLPKTLERLSCCLNNLNDIIEESIECVIVCSYCVDTHQLPYINSEVKKLCKGNEEIKPPLYYSSYMPIGFYFVKYRNGFGDLVSVITGDKIKVRISHEAKDEKYINVI